MSDLTVPPLPVVADLRRGAEECTREGMAGWGNAMSDAADAIASLQARLEAAERDAASLRQEIARMKDAN